MKNMICFAVSILLLAIFVLVKVGDNRGSAQAGKISTLRIWKDTPVWELAQVVDEQNVKRIEQIIKERPALLDYQEEQYGASLLIWAVGMEKFESARSLLECGANPNISTISGETALFIASHYSWIDYNWKADPKFVRLLLSYGADLDISYVGNDKYNSTTEPGTTALMASIGCGIEKTIALVEAGADINAQTNDTKRTAAVIALMNGTFNSFGDWEKYAQYLIVDKRANITRPYYRGHINALKDQDPNDAFYPVEILRNIWPRLDTETYKVKMAIVEEFGRQGVDYWNTPVPEYTLEGIREYFPDIASNPARFEEYIRKY